MKKLSMFTEPAADVLDRMFCGTVLCYHVGQNPDISDPQVFVPVTFTLFTVRAEGTSIKSL